MPEELTHTVEQVENELPPGALAAGQVLAGRYRLGRQLGRGGMGVVWRAFDLKLRVDLALKALHGHLTTNERGLEMLRREVRAAREVVSPNVCRIYDLVEAAGRELVSMEYIDGITLLELLEDQGPLELKEAQDIASQFLAGLEAIHRAGLVHRDVKPENIMITRAGRVVLMDFGLAKPGESGKGTIAGTPAYMAPEQAAGLPLDARADVYAAGVVLAEMVSPDGVRDLISRQSLWEGVRTEPARVPDTPWAPVIRRAVAKDRNERQSTAHTLIRELEEQTLRHVDAEELHPYPGLASFTESDTEFFFGREAEVEKLWARLGTPRMLAVVGPSGAGKTSFIRAGVLPAAPPGWARLICTPGEKATRSLARVMARELAADTEMVEKLVAFDEADVAVEVVSHWRASHEQAVLVVDQFEELFTLNPLEEQESFANLLRRLVLEADVHVVLSLRDDFLMRCRELDALQSVFSELTALPALAGSSLRRALVQPAARCGYRFEDDQLISEMLDEVAGERGALPLLAFATAQLWERRDRDGGLLTRAAYEAIDGVGGALAQHAEATIEAIGTEQLELVRELFRNLVSSEGTRAVRGWEELLSVFAGEQYSNAEKILRTLVDARLLTSYEISDTERESTRQVEIIHESLLNNWPRLLRWQTQDADAALLRDQLRQAARTWEEHDRSEDLLWTGAAYRELALWRERYTGGLSASEKAFAEAMEHHAMRRKRRRRAAVAALFAAALAVAAITTTLWRRSEQQTRRAEGARLLAMAQTELAHDNTVALAWATAGLELLDTPEARRLAVETLWQGPTRFAVEPCPGQPQPSFVTFSPDGSFAVAHDHESSQMVVWSEAGGAARVVGGPLTSGPAAGIAFSETRTSEPVLVQLGLGPSFKLWSVPGFEPLEEVDLAIPGEDPERSDFQVRPGVVFRFAWVSGTWVARAHPLDGSMPTSYPEWVQSRPSSHHGLAPSGTSILLSRGREIVRRPLEQLGDARHDEVVARDPDDIVWWHVNATDRLVVYDQGGITRVWSLDAKSPQLCKLLQGPGKTARLDDSGRHLLNSAEGGLFIWHLNAPPDAEPTFIRWPGNLAPPHFSFDPTGKWVAAVADGKLLLWPFSGLRPRVIRAHATAVEALAFSGNGSRLVSSATSSTEGNRADTSVRLWPLSSASGELGRSIWDQGGAALAADATGRRVLLSHPYPFRTFSMGISMLNTADGSSRLLRPGGPGVYLHGSLAFSPDGRHAVAATSGAHEAAEMVLRVWDTANGQERELSQLEAPLSTALLDGITEIQFTAEGRLLSSGAGGVRLWDLESGEAEWLLRTGGNPWPWMVMSADREGRLLLTGKIENIQNLVASGLSLFDRSTGVSRPITSHGAQVWPFALDPSGTSIVSGVPGEGVLQVGSVDGSEPHLLYTNGLEVGALAISPDGRWIATGHEDGSIRLWPMPDVTKPPLHTLPHDELVAKLKTLTNLRAVRDTKSPGDWKIEPAAFPGWKELPSW